MIVPKPRVLIVEDEGDFSFILEYFFSRSHKNNWGWLATVTPDGEQALGRLVDAEAAGKRYDLIVLDLMLPGLSGAEVLAEVRRRGIPTPVAIVTNMTVYEAQRETKGLKPDQLWTKNQFDELRRYAAELKLAFDARPENQGEAS